MTTNEFIKSLSKEQSEAMNALLIEQRTELIAAHEQGLRDLVDAKKSEIDAKEAALAEAEKKRLADVAAKEAEKQAEIDAEKAKTEAERLAKEEALKPEKQRRIEALEMAAREAQAEADRLKAEVA